MSVVVRFSFDVIFRVNLMMLSHLADRCMTSLFVTTWMCVACGREWCQECLDRFKALQDGEL